MDSVDSPLCSATPIAWAQAVLRDPLELLNDHAHLEKKASQNAMDLLLRWPDPSGTAGGTAAPPELWVRQMTAIAREEAEHLQAVVRLIEKRGGALSRAHRNPYAKALREQVRPGGAADNLLDRLMVSALIELRSCERFAVLAACLDASGDDEELRKLYHGLWSSEHGHYLTFLQLARDVPTLTPDAIDQRWAQMLDAEAAILAGQAFYIGMHSGVPGG